MFGIRSYFVFACLMILVIKANSINTPILSGDFVQTGVSVSGQIKNETKHFVITRAELISENLSNRSVQQSLRFTLKNTYQKAITAFAVRSVDGTQMTVEFLMTGMETDGRILPEAEYSESYPLPQAFSWNPNERPFTILGIVFEDGNTEGDSKVTENIIANRTAFNDQLKKGIAVFRELLSVPSNERKSTLSQLRLAFSKHRPTEAEILRIELSRRGNISGIDYVLARLQELESLDIATEKLDEAIKRQWLSLERMSFRLSGKE